MIITAFFSSDGAPDLGLSPTINIRDLADNSLIVPGEALSEVGDGFYKYGFGAYDPSVDYVYLVDGGPGLDIWERFKFGSFGSKGEIAQIKTKTDALPTDTAQKLTDVGTAITATRERTDRLPDTPASQGDVGGAQGVIEAAIDAAEGAIRGGVKDLQVLSTELAAHDAKLVAVKARTDNLPADPADQSLLEAAIAAVGGGTGALTAQLTAHDLALKGRLDTVDTEIFGVRERTDRLPSDPADQSLLEGAISASASAIRGGPGTLETVKNQLSLHDSDIKAELSGVREKTNNLPASTVLELEAIEAELAGVRERTNRLPGQPADQSDVEAAVNGAKNTIQLHLTTRFDTLDAEIAGIDLSGFGTLDTHLDTIEGKVDGVKAKTDRLPLDPASQASLASAIVSAEANIRGGSATLSAVKTAVSDHDFRVTGRFDTLDTGVAGVRERTNRLPNDPASQVSVESKIATAEANIRGGADTVRSVRLAVGDLAAAEAGHHTEVMGAVAAIDVDSAVTDLGEEVAGIKADVVDIKADVAFLRQIEGGRWELFDNQMIFYGEDNVTEVARFDLFNVAGAPTVVNVTERRRTS